MNFSTGTYTLEENLEDLRFLEKEEYAEQILKLNCYDKGVKFLPNLKRVKEVYCGNNQIEFLPNWENIEGVWCQHNQIKTFPNWTIIKRINCSHNPLSSLPKWKDVEEVWCFGVRLISMPNWKKVKFVWIWGSEIKLVPFKNEIVGECNPFMWRIGHVLSIQKLTRTIYSQKLLCVKNFKEEFHNELKYSPDLEFYKDTAEYKHFKENQSGQ